MLPLLQPWRLARAVFPILRWYRSYDVSTAAGDLIAGVTVALTLIPQSIAYASLAGLPPQYGLYASFAGGFVYGVLGTCPQINIGPTALLSLLTFTYTNGSSADFAVLLCFMAGVVQLVAGVAQLGFLVNFVSLPVVSGFTSAAAITIASSQIKGLLGISFKADTFVGTWKGVVEHIHETRLTDTLLSSGCCVVLLGMKALKDIHIKDAGNEKCARRTKILRKSVWFISVARNAVVVVAAAIIAYCVHQTKREPFILTGVITPGLPVPKLPPFHTVVGNTTYTAGEMFSHLGSGLLVVPLVAIIANVAIAKAFSNGQTLDATQEIVALGACNLVGAFFSSFPINGSFTRSALSDASGVRTPAAGFYTGIIVILTLSLLTPYFYYIPRAAFAAVITCAVLHMVDLQIVKKLWKTSRLDIIPLLGTFVFCLALGIELGLLCGIGVDLMLLLYYQSRPPLDIQLVNDQNLPPHYAVRPVGGLHFASAEKVRAKLNSLQNSKKRLLKNQPPNPLETLTIDPENDVMRSQRTVKANDGTINDENDVTINGYVVQRNDNHTENQKTEETDKNAAISNNTPPTTIVTVAKTDAPHSLVVYCEALYRVDYTVLQSMKTLVKEWRGRVYWVGVRPYLKHQLNNALTDPIYCNSVGDLSNALRQRASPEIVPQLSNIRTTSDTQL